MSKNKRNTRANKRKGPVKEIMSPASSVSKSPIASPKRKKRKIKGKELSERKTIKINNIRKQFENNIYEVYANIIKIGQLKTVPTRSGISKNLFELTVADETGSIDIKFWGEDAAKQYAIITAFEPCHIGFSTTNIQIQTKAQYNNGSVRWFLNAPALTIEPKQSIKNINFNKKSVKYIQDEAVSEIVDCCGIITNVTEKAFARTNGLIVNIGDTTGNIRYYVWNDQDVNTQQLEIGAAIFICNAKISTYNDWVSVNSGVIMDSLTVDCFENLKKTKEMLLEYYANGQIIETTEVDYDNYLECSIRKFNSVKRKFDSDGTMKDKYKEIKIDAVISSFNNLDQMWYYSKIDDKRKKKLTSEQLEKLPEDEVEPVYLINFNVADEDDNELGVWIFGQKGKELFGVDVEKFISFSDRKKDESLNKLEGKRIQLFFKAYEGTNQSGDIILNKRLMKLEML